MNRQEDPPLLTVTGLCAELETESTSHPIFRQLDLSISRGEIVGLLGASGSGKTTLGLTLLGLQPEILRITAGEARFEQWDLLQLTTEQWRPIRGRRIAMIFQEPATALNPLFTVGSLVSEGLRRHAGLRRSEARSAAADLLAEVGLSDTRRCMKAYPHELSGGMRQRVMIATALACNPDLLICDEPTSALDLTVQAQILRLLQQLQEDRNLSILLISHDLPVLRWVSDRVLALTEGALKPVWGRPVPEEVDRRRTAKGEARP